MSANNELKNEATDGAKPVLVEVAVLSAYRSGFDLWVKENRKENERYHFISRIQDVWGRVFHRIEKIHMWVDIPNFLEVERRCLERVRNLP